MSIQSSQTFAVGRNVLLMSTTPQTADASGVLTAGTIVSMLGTFEEAQFEFTLDTVEISSADGTIRNYVPTKSDFNVSITEIVAASGNSKLLAQFQAGLFASVTAQLEAPGAGSGGKTILCYGVMTSCNRNIVEGKQVVTLVIRPIGIPPSYS